MAEREGERIYVRNEAGGLEPLMEKQFDEERHLQELLAKHPELLEGTQIRPDDPRRWILITREQDIADRWSLDHLVIDQDATPTLVEVKLGSNPDARRKVVGQMLDYAAHAHTLDVAALRRAFENQSNAEDLLNNLIGDKYDDDRTFWEQVARNLKEKRLRLLFVADAIPDELARIVEFLNEQMPDIEVLAVEIKQFFTGTESQTLVPRVIGRLAKPNRSVDPNWHDLYQEFWRDFLATFVMKYKDWKVHKTTKGQKKLTNAHLQLDANGKTHHEMYYSFDYARREGDPTRVNFWVIPSNWGEPSKVEEAERIVHELNMQKDEIKRHFGESDLLNWDPVDGRPMWGIHIRHPDESLAIGDRKRWPEVRDWGIKHLGALRDAIKPHLDGLS